MRQALGKGIDALISNEGDSGTIEESLPSNIIRKIAIDKIKANHLQPRKYFDEEKIRELSDSIREHGLAQPVLVSKDSADDGFELIAGERRLRAAQLAGLKEIDCIVKPSMPNLERLSLSLIENLQRQDLNPIEEALGFRKLAQDFNLTQGQIAQAVGKSRVAVANTLRLLDLPPEHQQAIQDGRISEGHGRALLMIQDPAGRQRLFKKIVAGALSVRQAEEFARMLAEGRRLKNINIKSAEIKSVETELQHRLGTKVELKAKRDGKGRLVVHYFSLEDLDRIIGIIKNAVR